MRRAGAVAAALALAAGCGGDGTPAPSDTASAPAPAGRDALTVRHLDEARPLRTVVLRCEGADRAACARVAALLPSLSRRPGEVCTEIYGGPQRIALSGRLGGRPVDVTVGRRDGCEIDRYDRLAAALGRAGPPPVSAGG